MLYKTIPYIAVLLSAALGMNVMLVLLLGIGLTGIVGIADGSSTFMEWTGSLTSGIMGMSELILISMMAGGIFALITKQGAMDRLIHVIQRKIRTKKGAELSICLLVGCVNVLTANNTVAILSVGDVAKQLAKHYGVDARRSASLLDTTSCAVHGLLPYCAQLLMASSLAGISALSIIPYLYYPMFIGLIALLSILIPSRK